MATITRNDFANRLRERFGLTTADAYKLVDVVFDEIRDALPELGQLNAAESRVRLAEINARQSETDFERMKTLYGQKLISAEEYEKSEVAVMQAREELQTAKDNLQIVKEGITQSSASFSSTLIRSTIDGLILDVPIKEGNSVIMSNTFNDGSLMPNVCLKSSEAFSSHREKVSLPTDSSSGIGFSKAMPPFFLITMSPSPI